MKLLNVSIVTYHTDLDELSACLESLRSECVNEIFIIDNAQEERIREFCAGRQGVTYIPNDNTGYGSAHNIALRRSVADRVDFHLVLNSDVYFEPAILSKAVEYLHVTPSCGMLHPLIYGCDGNRQFTARMLPTPADLILRRFLPAGWFAASRRRYLLKDLPVDEPVDVPYIQGSFMLIRTAALADVGLFDERFFMYPEDIDLSRRIHASSRVVLHPGLKVTHAHRASSYHNWRMLRVHITNMIKYFNKWGWIFDRERTAVNATLRRKLKKK